MAGYAFRTLDERKEIQEVYELGASAKELSELMGVSLSVAYKELQRGYDGTRLPDMRKRYDAKLAHRRVIESLERRGKRKEIKVPEVQEGA